MILYQSLFDPVSSRRLLSQPARQPSKIRSAHLDDWKRYPISSSETRNLLEILDDRFGHVSTLVASQVPVGEWYSRFPDPTHADAILDRSIHNAYKLNLTGDSQPKVRSPIPISST